MAEPSKYDPPLTTEDGDFSASDLLLDRLAHDLRGPLSPLQTATYLLRRPELEAAQRDELLSIIDRQTTRLSTMVQEVSDWMRARRSRLVGRTVPVAPALVVDLAAASSGPAVDITVDTALEEVAIDGDAQRLVQMLATLFAFMQARDPNGTVSLRAHAHGDEVVLEIATPAARWAAGERVGLFAIAEAAPFDEGLGMRLLIAREIAIAHGGEIQAADTAQGNALIRVRLPTAPAEVEG
ncbi:HAMP domain-containing histidine kinase [Lysobacter sp. H21R4]|uniref:sensor histidine kinase n=1 Tax=Lysobacter sp. H21R4 TaxID=2781021 RepID=UPI001889B2E5|nr:HAMP domain-containing sensor histidine kinase [Lysobacter sp. H21R4]QOY61767.1 HAMP domain-containing histidine kinase [Lysobacter sp. H21R4]